MLCLLRGLNSQLLCSKGDFLAPSAIVPCGAAGTGPLGNSRDAIRAWDEILPHLIGYQALLAVPRHLRSMESSQIRGGGPVIWPLFHIHNLLENHPMGHSPGAERAVHLWVPVSNMRLTCCVTSRNCRASLNLSDHPICKVELLLALPVNPTV